MKRVIRKGGEALNARLTDAMIEQANKIVDEYISQRESKEDAPRYCDIYGEYHPNLFAIQCRTTFDYQTHKFELNEDGSLTYKGMEGDFR